MTFNFRPQLLKVDNLPGLDLKQTHPNHIAFNSSGFLNQGRNIAEMGEKIGSGAVTRAGGFEKAMLGALDNVSASQQFASSLHEAAMIDPDSVNVEDITMAQAQARISLDITRNVLNRIVQGWRDLINTR